MIRTAILSQPPAPPKTAAKQRRTLSPRAHVAFVATVVGSGVLVSVLCISWFESHHTGPGARDAGAFVAVVWLAASLVLAVARSRSGRRRQLLVGVALAAAVWVWAWPVITSPFGVRLPWTTASGLSWRMYENGDQFDAAQPIGGDPRPTCSGAPTGSPLTPVGAVRGLLAPGFPVFQAGGELLVRVSPSCFVGYEEMGGG